MKTLLKKQLLRTLAPCLTLVLTCSALTLSAQDSENLLVNPGFEEEPYFNGWTRFDAQFNASIANFNPHLGTNSYKVFGQFNGKENYSGLFQDFPAKPGDKFEASAFAFIDSKDAMAAGNSAWIEVKFQDATYQDIKWFKSDVSVDSESVTDTWTPLTVSGAEAPEGTVVVRIQINFRQESEGKGATFFDDISLEKVGEGAAAPAAPAAGQP